MSNLEKFGLQDQQYPFCDQQYPFWDQQYPSETSRYFVRLRKIRSSGPAVPLPRPAVPFWDQSATVKDESVTMGRQCAVSNLVKFWLRDQSGPY